MAFCRLQTGAGSDSIEEASWSMLLSPLMCHEQQHHGTELYYEKTMPTANLNFIQYWFTNTFYSKKSLERFSSHLFKIPLSFYSIPSLFTALYVHRKTMLSTFMGLLTESASIDCHSMDVIYCDLLLCDSTLFFKSSMVIISSESSTPANCGEIRHYITKI